MQNKHACLLGNSEMLTINKHTLLSFNDLEVVIVPTMPVYRNASYSTWFSVGVVIHDQVLAFGIVMFVIYLIYLLCGFS